MTIKQLSVPAIFFFIFNGVGGGLLYTWLKFEVLGHSTGTGVTPGPWLVLPFLSIGVLAGSSVLALIVYAILKEMKKVESTSLHKTLLVSFIGFSVLFHSWYVLTTVLNPNS